MANAFPTPLAAPTSRPARDSAFVIHLEDHSEGPGRGRAEHVATGRSVRFESLEELLCFMRATLTAIAADER